MRAASGARPGGVPAVLLAVLVLSGCTGAPADRQRVQRAPSTAAAPVPAAGPSLQFAVAASPIDCRTPGAATTRCVLGGSAVTARLGKLRIYHRVELGTPAPDGCARATLDGSVSGARWSRPLTGDGRWCAGEATLRYRLGGAGGDTGTLSYRRSPLGSATETLSGQLPAPPPGAAGLATTADRSVASRGCGERPRPRAGGSADIAVAADPALAGGATRRTYRLHVPEGYRPDRAVPALLFFHGSGGSAADVLDDLQSRLCVDRARIYAAGFSAGGGMANWLACELAGRIAAFASISGGFRTEPGGCHPSRPVSILDLHNTGDQIVRYAGSPASNDWPFRAPAVPTWLAQWADRDGCAADYDVFLGGPTVTGMRWSGCPRGAELVAYKIASTAHSAPRTLASRAGLSPSYGDAVPLAGQLHRSAP